jgi:beta-lactamase class A
LQRDVQVTPVRYVDEIVALKAVKRSVFVGGVAALPGLMIPGIVLATESFEPSMRRLETATHGRLGVAVLDTGSGAVTAYNGDDRFPMCSTFKLLAVAAVLQRVDAGTESLDRHIAYGNKDLLDYAPVTSKHVAEGFMTLGALCEAAIELSDNTAANVILSTLGGPPAVTRYARSLGDSVTRLDRNEPTLNTGIPGDERDTTSPLSMARDAQAVLLGKELLQASRDRLAAWLVGSTTGLNLVRAGIPPTWRAGDKTGLGGQRNAVGDSDTRNDIAIIWPPNRAPIIVTAYLTGCQLPGKQRDATLAAIGKIVAAARS